MTIRVGVIGAGAAGLVALRHLTARQHIFDAVAFEQTGHVSGTWVYTDRIGQDERGLPIHSSMYKSLRTNLPKEIMAFPDFPFPKDLPSFLHHTDVRKYLEDYASHFDLYQYIKFNTKVVKVSPVQRDTGPLMWNVTTHDVLQCHGSETSHQFDAVIVCNGHYSVPLIPELPGLTQFKGTVMHSHDYRIPDPFKDRVVAILGAASSGQDIALDVAPIAKHVFLLHNKAPLITVLPSNISQGPGIVEVLDKSLILNDGKEIQVDALVLCTGYRYDFSFLSPECQLNIREERVTPLYKHIVHTKYPTLFIIGLCKHILPFPQFHCQVLFVIAALTGKMMLPSREQMEADIENEFRWRTKEKGMPTRYAHNMGTLQWKYNDELAKLAGFEPIPSVIETLYNHVHDQKVKDLPGYKKARYELLSNTEFCELVQ